LSPSCHRPSLSFTLNFQNKIFIFQSVIYLKQIAQQSDYCKAHGDRAAVRSRPYQSITGEHND
ncbi:hypothetical protein, partial [Escherichia coli]|uniref:hypothetical protein n=1 Tax=Escherichia coli TaxID=562 RepID=UPI0019682B60